MQTFLSFFFFFFFCMAVTLWVLFGGSVLRHLQSVSIMVITGVRNMLSSGFCWMPSLF